MFEHQSTPSPGWFLGSRKFPPLVFIQISPAQCNTVLYCPAQNSNVQLFELQCSVVLFSSVQCSNVKLCRVHCGADENSAGVERTVQCSVVQLQTAQCSAVMTSPVQYSYEQSRAVKL